MAQLDITADREGDRRVLMLIGGGIFITVITMIAAMSFATLPDWAESVFSAIVGGSLVKLADVLSTLASLSSNRQLERVTDQLSTSTPPPIDPTPVDVSEAAEQVADAAADEAKSIQRKPK